MTNRQFEIIVVGAGPAGAMAAYHAAKAGRSVCIIDRLSAPSRPVRCGEGVGLKGISLTVPVRPEWILSTITRVRMVAPDGVQVDLSDIGQSFIIDREKFDVDLVKMATDVGAVFFNETNVESVAHNPESGYACISGETTFTAPCLIIADGVESRLARGLGWKTVLAPEDMETCSFARVTDPSIAADCIEFHVGNQFAPGGYAWVMPRGAGIANVGLGIAGSFSAPGKADALLSQFVAHRFPHSPLVSNRHCGGVPVARSLSPLRRGGAMVVGDAARQVNALNGGGIAYALHAGQLAGEAAAAAFTPTGFDSSKLDEYEKRWSRGHGKNQLITHDLKTFLLKRRDDAFYNRIAASLAGRKALGYLRVFLRTFAGHPIMTYKVFRLFR